MINLEIIEYFPKGVRLGDITYGRQYTVNLPVEGPATMDFKGERDAEGNYPTKTIELPVPVNRIEVPANFVQEYIKERKLRRSPNFRFPNELIANLHRFRLDDGVLNWSETLTDWSVLGGGEKRGILRGGLLDGLPEDEKKRLSREFAPTAPGDIVESADGYIVVGTRGGGTYLEGRVMPFPVGHPVYEYNQRNPNISHLQTPMQALSKQTIRELDLPVYADMIGVSGAVKDLYTIGAVRGNHGDHGSWNPCVVFVLESKWTTEQLREGYKRAVDRYEHERFIPVPIDRKVLTSLLRGEYEYGTEEGQRVKIPFSRLIDNGLGELLLYFRYRFGDGPYEQIFHELTTDPRYETTITEGNPFR